jgi:hypothetical protein
MRTKKVMQVLQDKKPRSVLEIMNATGMSRVEVSNAFASIIRNGYALAEPVRYTITDVGLERLAKRPQTRREKTEKQNKRMRLLRAAAKRAAARALVVQARKDALELSERARVSAANDMALADTIHKTPRSVFELGGRNA